VVKPLHAVVPVDLFVPGCPPSADTIWFVLSELLEGPHSQSQRSNAFWSLTVSRTITIEPVTRIEGHARITLQLNDEGRVDDARST
jgi:coenzyme F420-reducing hydrogenase gamma subunit